MNKRRPRLHIMAFRFIHYKCENEEIKIFNPFNSDVPASLEIFGKQWNIDYNKQSPVNIRYKPVLDDLIFEELNPEQRWNLGKIRVDKRIENGEVIPQKSLKKAQHFEAQKYIGKKIVVKVSKKF